MASGPRSFPGHVALAAWRATVEYPELWELRSNLVPGSSLLILASASLKFFWEETRFEVSDYGQGTKAATLEFLLTELLPQFNSLELEAGE